MYCHSLEKTQQHASTDCIMFNLFVGYKTFWEKSWENVHNIFFLTWPFWVVGQKYQCKKATKIKCVNLMDYQLPHGQTTVRPAGQFAVWCDGW